MHSTHYTERPNWLLAVTVSIVVFTILKMTH